MRQSVDSKTYGDAFSRCVWALKVLWPRILSLLVGIALFVVSLYFKAPSVIIACLAGAAVALLIATKDRLGYIPKEHIAEKAEILAWLINRTTEKIRMRVGEFNPQVFDTPVVVEALVAAAKRGVKVWIVMGSLGMDNEEDFKKHLERENRRMMKELREYLKDGCVTIFYGERPSEHFYVFDDNALVREEPHEPYFSLAWRWKRYIFYSNKKYSKEFKSSKASMNQVSFS